MSPIIIKLCLGHFLLGSMLEYRSGVCDGLETISAGQFLSGNQTLSSVNGTFELGFFSPGESGNYYIGIWNTSSRPNRVVVWVANREQPVSHPSSSQLKLIQDGDLVLLNESKAPIWSISPTSEGANSAVVMLLDGGNLIIRDALDLSRVLWQSSDHPTHHWLPGGKIGYNKRRNLKQKLTPWRSTENQAPSLFSVEVEQNGISLEFFWNDTKLYRNSGEWDGRIFKFIPETALNYYIKSPPCVNNENESYFTYEAGIPGALTRFLMDSSGQLRQSVWGVNFTSWTLFWTRPSLQCEVYAHCGGFGSCNNIQRPLCKCLPGFEPRDPKNWDVEDHTDGCRRKRPLQCNGGGEGAAFSVISQARFPSDAVTLPLENAQDCTFSCLRNCTCAALAYDDGRCFHWIGGLFNSLLLRSDDAAGKDIYVRVSASDMESARGKSLRSTIGSCFVILVLQFIAWGTRSRTGSSEPVEDSLKLFKRRELRVATKNFSEKLGEGGFGFVYNRDTAKFCSGSSILAAGVLVKSTSCTPAILHIVNLLVSY